MIDMGNLEEKLQEAIATDGKPDPKKLTKAAVWLSAFLVEITLAGKYEIVRENGQFKAYLDGQLFAAGSITPAGAVGHA